MVLEADESFDIEAAITNFLADPGADTLELPHMTTGQRKQARKLAEANKDVTCESFGFGTDRRLLLLKNRAPSVTTSPSGGGADAKALEGSAATPTPGADARTTAAVTSADAPKKEGDAPAWGLVHAGLPRLLPCAADASPVRIKNTFIDDWEPSAGAGQEHFIFRSMPPQMKKAGLAAESDEPCYVAPVSRDTPALASEPSSCATTAAVSVCSTTESGSDSSLESCNPNEAAHLTASTAPLKLEPQVRNTFIHFNTAAPADERVVQSMPHGMFGQALLAEAQAQAQARAEAAAAAVAAATTLATSSASVPSPLLSLAPPPPPSAAPSGYPLPPPSGPPPTVHPTDPASAASTLAAPASQQSYAAVQAAQTHAQAIAQAQAHAYAQAHAEAQAAAAAHAAVAAAAAVAGIPPSMMPPPSAPPTTPAPQLAAAPPVSAPPPTVAPGGDIFIMPGSKVVIEGLSKTPAFNGRVACVHNFDVSIGRYTLSIAMPDGSNLMAKVKRENLFVAA